MSSRSSTIKYGRTESIPTKTGHYDKEDLPRKSLFIKRSVWYLGMGPLLGRDNPRKLDISTCTDALIIGKVPLISLLYVRNIVAAFESRRTCSRVDVVDDSVHPVLGAQMLASEEA